MGVTLGVPVMSNTEFLPKTRIECPYSDRVTHFEGKGHEDEAQFLMECEELCSFARKLNVASEILGFGSTIGADVVRWLSESKLYNVDSDDLEHTIFKIITRPFRSRIAIAAKKAAFEAYLDICGDPENCSVRCLKNIIDELDD
jgi:hypothetical protein